jgi:hypothetical protein
LNFDTYGFDQKHGTLKSFGLLPYD